MLNTIPKEISFDDTYLYIVWKDGFPSKYNLLKLRKLCPCVTCIGGHGGNIGEATSHIKEISLVSWKKVGRYALNFTWSDNHDTGIYTYDSLREYSEKGLT